MPVNRIEEKLKENLEDAEFALLMYRVSQAEGERLMLENVQLKHDDNFSIPPELDRAAKSTISKAFAMKDAKNVSKKIGSVLSKVAVVVLVFNVLVVTLFSTASAFRANVLNFVYETFDIATSITMDGTAGERNTESSLSSLGWLPAGYELTNTTDWGTDGFISEYTNSEGLRIDFSCFPGNASTNVDTENAEIVEDVVINGNDGLYVKKGLSQSTVWGEESSNHMYILETDAVSESDFQTIIDNLE